MSTMIHALQSEIQRLAKKQIRAIVGPLKKEVVRLKKISVVLRRNVAQLQKQAEVLLAAEARRSRSAPVMSEAELAKVRLTASGVVPRTWASSVRVSARRNSPLAAPAGSVRFEA